jgi:hypothetical protein
MKAKGHKEQNVRTANESFENVAKFKYLGKAFMAKLEQIKSRKCHLDCMGVKLGLSL